MNWKKLFLITLCACALISAVGCAKNDPLVTWNIYKGEVNGFIVTIDEDRHESYPEGMVRRIVHVAEPSRSYVGITGHDYNGDGNWDRIFRCGYPESVNGCNSVLFSPSRVRTWEPCSADKDRLKPFTDQEVYDAAEKLYRAMSVVHNPEHLVQTLESFRKETEKS